MYAKKCYLYLFLVAAMALGGCGIRKQSVCRPVLFPYVEYGYKAESRKLSETHTTYSTEAVVDFQGIKIPIPSEWEFEKVSNRSLKIFKDKQNFFSLSFFENNPLQSHDSKMLKMIGCKDFSGRIENVKNSKDFYTDLFFFTDNDLNAHDSFWQYYILWAKTNNLRNSSQLTHYTGKNLVAFKIDFDSGIDCRHPDIKIRITIFPKKIEPHYLSILSSGIKDDAFFVRFLESLDAINQ